LRKVSTYDKEPRMNLEDMLTAEGVAGRLEVTVSAVHRLSNRGTLPYRWIAGRKLFRKDAIDAYLANDEAQKRRRNGGLITQGELELDVPAAVRRMRAEASVDAQRPGGDRGGRRGVIF
jgi:helix-turn-helix protein